MREGKKVNKKLKKKELMDFHIPKIWQNLK